MTDQSTTNEDPNRDEDSPLDQSEDARWIDAVRQVLDDGERSEGARAAFRARLEDRIERRTSSTWRPWLLTASAAFGAMVVWVLVPGGGVDPGNESDVATDSAGLLAYAYYETEYLAVEDEANGFLSDEYQAIANAFDVP